MLTVLCWFWGNKYTEDHVRRLAVSVKRHLHVPYRFVCLSDRFLTDWGHDIRHRGIPVTIYEGKVHSRRLWVFSDDIKRILCAEYGDVDRILQLDIDCVIVNDITPIVKYAELHPFSVWKHNMTTRFGYVLNPSVMFLDLGEFSSVWTNYLADPDRSLFTANRAGWCGSDQAVISQAFSTVITPRIAHPTCATFGEDYGLYSIRDLIRDNLQQRVKSTSLFDSDHIPSNASIINFYGRFDPAQFQHLSWVKQNWTDLL